MCSIECYTQDVDFSIAAHGVVDAELAITLVRELPCSNVAKQFCQKQRPCRPLLGFCTESESESDAFIEFAVCGDGTLHCRLDYPVTVKGLLGGLVTDRRSIDSIYVSAAFAESLVELYFAQRISEIADHLTAHNQRRR